MDTKLKKLFSRCCKNNMCFTAKDILKVVEPSSNSIERKDFPNFCLVLTHRLRNISKACQPAESSLSNYLTNMKKFLTENSEKISKTKLNEFLDPILPHVSHDNHEHVKEKGHDEEKDHDHHEEEHHHDDDKHGEELPPVFKKQCFSSDIIYNKADLTEVNITISDKIKSVSEVMVYYLLSDYNFEDSCRLLPKRSVFIDDIYDTFGSQDTMTTDNFGKIINKLGIGKVKSKDGHDGHDHSSHGGHDHSSHGGHDHGGHDGHDHDKHTKRSLEHRHTNKIKCLNHLEIVAIFTEESNKTIVSPKTFVELCPALVQQVVSGACDAKNVIVSHTPPSRAEQYGYGIASVFIICLCSVVGVFLMVCRGKKVFVYSMAFFEGVAVGTLASDAFLHLIPQALGVHNHNHEHTESEGEEPNPLWFSMAGLAGAYGFYLLEIGFEYFSEEGGSHSHDIMPITKVKDVSMVSSVSDAAPDKPKLGMTPSLTLIIVLGDALHNFADGLAIGAAYSASVFMGLMTSITVFCHELPHELGDMAILLGNGITLTRALTLNFISSLTAFMGLFVGLVISTNYIIRRWIFAVTAGMFLYIALVDLLPLMKRSKTVRSKIVLFANAGLLLGVLVMTLLGVYEENFGSH
ncbi:zinc transporter ZIP6-like [Argonauta hians]